MKVKLLNKKLVSAFLMSILFYSGYVSANSEIKQDMSPVLTVEFEDQSNPDRYHIRSIMVLKCIKT